MKLFRVVFHDNHDTFGYQDFSNREAAEACIKWHASHLVPEDEIGWRDIIEVDVKPPMDSFVPPMTEEEYHAKYDEFLVGLTARMAYEEEIDDELIF